MTSHSTNAPFVSSSLALWNWIFAWQKEIIIHAAWRGPPVSDHRAVKHFSSRPILYRKGLFSPLSSNWPKSQGPTSQGLMAPFWGPPVDIFPPSNGLRNAQSSPGFVVGGVGTPFLWRFYFESSSLSPSLFSRPAVTKWRKGISFLGGFWRQMQFHLWLELEKTAIFLALLSDLEEKKLWLSSLANHRSIPHGFSHKTIFQPFWSLPGNFKGGHTSWLKNWRFIMLDPPFKGHLLFLCLLGSRVKGSFRWNHKCTKKSEDGEVFATLQLRKLCSQNSNQK